MPLCFQILASGSKGNAILLQSPQTRILLDAGLSGKELAKRLSKTPTDGHRLDALIVSHEHQDHVRGLGVMSRRFDLPVYLSQGTLDHLPSAVGQLAYAHVFQPGNLFKIGDLSIYPFTIPHDAHEPVGFVIEHEGCRLGVCTDLGVATQLVKTRLQGCHGLILEANHDLELLLKGPYPWHLKQRIRSRHGHLSNVDTCELLKTIHHAHLQAVIFAHLSEINNHPDLVSQNFAELACCPEWEHVHFAIGRQHEVGTLVELP